jgi:hypothetical protein
MVVPIKVLVLGINHYIQEIDHEGQLLETINEYMKHNPVDLIAEEWSQETKKNFPTVASWSNPTIRHNMEMTDAQMNEAGILCAIRDRRQNGPPDAYLDPEDHVRERHWVKEIEVYKPQKGVIALCGMNHVKTFSEKLKEAGFVVTSKTLEDWPWFVEWITQQRNAEEAARLER